MGKIVKYCSSCDEGFAEKFGFCPDCGQALQAFEMNPVFAEAPQAEIPQVDEPAPAPVAAEPLQPLRDYHDEIVEQAAPAVEQPVANEEPVVEAPASKAAAAAAVPFVRSEPVDIDRVPASLEAEHAAFMREGSFYVTVIEEKNVQQRNYLLLGSLCFVIFSLMTGLVYNIFSKDLNVGAINDEIFSAVIVDDVPMTIEEQKQAKKDKDAGGGGGGGREEKEEVTQGDLADQAKNPTRPPDAKVPRFDDFELKTPPPQTEGNKTYDKKFDRWGDPNGRFANFSNGTGSGGGQGSGVGTGQGSGRGTGNGSGNGSGSGGGLGSGNGNGTGGGEEGSLGPPPPKPPVGVTQGLNIISKPRPGYTDAARQANVQGTVILRVTFLANGQIGSIAPVKGLPNGLTEQAIAAARRISFEPKKVNGIGQPVTRQIEYTFSIY